MYGAKTFFRWRKRHPLEPNWEGSGPGVKNIEDMVAIAQHGPLGPVVLFHVAPAGIEQPSVTIEADRDVSEKLPEAGSALRFLMGKANEKRNNWVDPCLLSQILKGSIVAAIEKTAHKRSSIKIALKVLLPLWRQQQREGMVKYSRRQLLESLIPNVGERGRRPAS